MKKIILTALLNGLIYSFGICQGPTLFNYNTVPKINDILMSFLVDTTGVIYNMTGANVIWDYSTIKVSSNEAYSFYLDPETTPYISSFNNATLANGFSTNYSYYYADTNEYTWLGSGSSSTVIVNTDPMKICVFPFNYGDQMNDSLYATYSLSSKIHQNSGYISLVADGWGTLKLPKNTYPVVLRTKGDQYIKDTADGVKTESYYTSYYWYDGIHNVPLLEIMVSKKLTYGNPTPTFSKNIFVADFTGTVSIPSLINSSSFNVYPNPANKELNIELNLNQHTNVDISLIDLYGHLVCPIYSKEMGLGKYINTTDITGMAKGIYAVKIITGNDVQIKKIIIQ